MKFRILSFAVAIIAVVNAPAWGQVFQQGSMKFRLAFLDTADRGNIDWIVADGEITNKTPNEFRQFLSLNKIKHGTKIEVYFNSPGGNIIGGLKLGEIIREFALGTRVARSVAQGRVLLNGEKPESDEPGHSYSACAVAFLGGKWRIASDRSLGVHQHYLEEALSDPKALKFSAVDFSVQQMLSGLLADYVSRMGVDARFIVLASMTKPNEIYAFTSEEMKQFRITWNDLEYTDWSFELYKDGLIAVSKTLNGEKFATLFCRKDRILRVLVNMPVYSSSSASEIDEIIKDARVDIFGR